MILNISKTKTLTILLYIWVYAVESSLYQIPEVAIEVYYPRGLRVLLPHEDGTQLFAFHGNANRAMRDYEIGQYYDDVLRPFNGSWIFEDGMVRLRKGDRLHYWLYVLHDRLGYRKDKQVFVIDELIMGNMPRVPTEAPSTPHTNIVPSATPANPQDELQTCNQLIVNLTRKLVDTSSSFDKLEEENELLIAMLSRNPDLRKLTLRGRLSTDDAPSDVVALVLSEKLGLRPTIAAAVRNPDRSITFELADLRQTLDVIECAKDKLANSTVVSITY